MDRRQAVKWALVAYACLAVLGGCVASPRTETATLIPLDSVCTVTATGLSCVPPGTTPPDPPIPPATGTGTWSLISVGATGRYNWYYNLGAACPTTGEMWMAWSGVTSRYSPTSNTWSTDAQTNSMGWRENFAAICDAAGVVHIAPGTSGPPDWSGFVTYNMTTKTYTKIAGGGCNAHSVLGLDPTRARLVTFGGWSTNCAIQARPVSGTQWTPLAPTGPVPPLTQEDARETSRRGGVDSRTGNAWVLADDRELYVYTAASNAWARVPTTGTKPGRYAIAALHETANTIVAAMGCDGLNDSDCATTSQQSFLLDLTSKAWRPGPTGPEPVPMSKRHAVWDAKGQRVIVFVASTVPVGGMLGTAVWAWVPSGGTPPPAASYSTTAVAAGPGTVGVSPPGSTSAGSTRTLTATADPSALFLGWTPTPCAASFPQPAANLTCTGTFQSSGGGGGPIPLKTFVPKPLPETGTPYPAGRGSKDVNHAFDGQRLIFGAGDIGSSGVADLYAYNVAPNTWTPIEVGCIPSSRSAVMLNHPSDRGPMIVDKRGTLWNWNGVPYPDGQDQPCGPGGAIQKAGLLTRTADGVWGLVTGTRTNSLGGGRYDSTADAMLFLEQSQACSGNPGALVIFTLSTGTRQTYPMCAGVTWNGSSGGWMAGQQPERVFFGWDDVARKLYLITLRQRLDASGLVAESQWPVYVFDMATKQWTVRRAAPVNTISDPQPFHIATPAWDSVSKRLLWPVVADGPCGTVKQMLTYDPATDGWESHPVPDGIGGNSGDYDPVANVYVLAGREFCQKNTAVYLWRYGNAPTRR